MNKNVLVICTSPRNGGNSERLADEFIKGAEEAGNKVEKVTLHDKKINFCRGCLICQETKECAICDDANEIVEKMYSADCIVFSTPIYYFEMCGQMKTMLDRSNPLYLSDYRFREIYLLASSAESYLEAVDGAVAGLKGWIACFEKAELKGVIRGIGAADIGDIEGNPALIEAYETGRKI